MENMKIGIVTQPLKLNYGGYLQAWALQEKLRQMGHSPMTIDYLPKVRWWKKYIFTPVGNILYKSFGIGRFRHSGRREDFEAFVGKNMSLTKRVHIYRPSLVKRYGFDAVISGSDQVWRPRYNRKNLENMFLRFADRGGVKRIAYAASFGVDEWEYTPEQTSECSRLAKMFDGISVREASGVDLCRNHLGVEAIEVLDPTLLLTCEDYEKLCSNCPRQEEAYLSAYILDLDEDKSAFIEKVAAERNLKLKVFSADKSASFSIEQWLSMYRDASFVITDSFHGTVFSIIFHKPFVSIGNKGRGLSRFHSLLAKFGLENRLVMDVRGSFVAGEIDWASVDGKLAVLRENAVSFLAGSLK